MGWRMWKAIEEHCRWEGGYSGAIDANTVSVDHGVGQGARAWNRGSACGLPPITSTLAFPSFRCTAVGLMRLLPSLQPTADSPCLPTS